MDSLKQLYVDMVLTSGMEIAPPKELSKRLSRVLRFKSGDKVALFNGRDGLFEVEILDDKANQLRVGSALKEMPASHVESTLIMACVKKNAMDLVFRQATEMGVTHIQPVITDYTVVDKINAERVRSLLVEASEQCERLDVPELLSVKKLKDVVEDTSATIYWAAEHIGGKWGAHKSETGQAILIGPEGGFSEAERDYLKGLKHVQPVGLGSYILRADTAVVAALSRFNENL